jgi:hypothetical protein
VFVGLSNPDDNLDAGQRWPFSYAASAGTWFAFDPASKRGGDGAFPANPRWSLGEVRPATSSTD